MIYVATIIYDDTNDGLMYSGNMPLPMVKMAINRIEKAPIKEEKDDGKMQEEKPVL